MATKLEQLNSMIPKIYAVKSEGSRAMKAGAIESWLNNEVKKLDPNFPLFVAFYDDPTARIDITGKGQKISRVVIHIPFDHVSHFPKRWVKRSLRHEIDHIRIALKYGIKAEEHELLDSGWVVP